MNKPRIFVGTMYTEEGDFSACMQRIKEQEGVSVSHFIISGMKEKQAHNALWHAWNDQKSEHDLFVKVDADTVLTSTHTLKIIADLFRENSRVTGLQAPLQDYMTNTHINGLNAFSPVVTFNDTRDELYCDRQVDVNHDVVLRVGTLPQELVPAGHHCYHSTERQAFHYGVHRMLKNQRHIISQVCDAWNVHQDRVRGFALIGASVAGAFSESKRFNYSDDEFQNAFERAKASYDMMVQVWRQ